MAILVNIIGLVLLFMPVWSDAYDNNQTASIALISVGAVMVIFP
jgi:uncharacterized membrane protein